MAIRTLSWIIVRIYISLVGFSSVFSSAEVPRPTARLSPACRIAAAAAAASAKTSTGGSSNQRIVVIGDVHGELGGLLEVLNMAGVVDGNECVWAAKPQPAGGTLLVQVGDIVDRGPSATEAWHCLKTLQESAPAGSEVVRLVGNHDIWWLEGFLRDRNPQTDTKAKVTSLVLDMKSSILRNKVRGAYYRTLHGVDLLFTHSGFRQDMKRLVLGAASASPSTSEAKALAEFTNKLLFDSVKKCSHEDSTCKMRHELFEAGPERGGESIGGPFWTDFSVLEEEEASKPSESLIQVFQSNPFFLTVLLFVS
jgi:hypothetical protein